MEISFYRHLKTKVKEEKWKCVHGQQKVAGAGGRAGDTWFKFQVQKQAETEN